MQEFFKLVEKADNCLKNNITVDNDLINKIKKTVSEKGYIGIAQINTISGDLEYNAKKIAKYIKFAEKIGLDCIVFPELSLTGCSMNSAIERHEIIQKNSIKWIKGLAKLTKNTIAIVGELCNIENTYLSCAYALHNGNIKDCFRIGTSHYDKYAVSLNNDYMNKARFLSENSNKIGLLINCVSFTYKQYKKILENSSDFLAKKFKTPILYVNQIGANDSILFEGISSVYGSNGKLIARAKAFEEQLMIVNPFINIGKIYPLPNGYEKFLDEEEFSLDYANDMERTYKALILGIKDYFSKCGLKRAVLGLSGGLDSTVCATLLTDALGKENVLGVSMPSKITTNESKSDAKQLAENLGINFYEVPIRSIVDAVSDEFNDLFKNIEKIWNFRYKQSFTHDNIQARTRATILWGISNEFESCIPIATSDKSEAYMGYATINGDMSGGYAPIADITKTKLFALARWLNKNRKNKNAIPEAIINKRPGAELAIDPKTGKPLIAEDALMPYEFLDEVIWRIENKHESYNELLNVKFVYEKHHKISKEQKTEWLDKFYRRMSTALYKWSIAAPSVMVEEHSINKCDYSQLITSSRINFKEVDEEYINESLK